MTERCDLCKHWTAGDAKGYRSPNAKEAEALIEATKKVAGKIAPGLLADAVVEIDAGKCGKWENSVTLADMNCPQFEAK